MSDKVKVNIDITETTRYSKQIEITQAEYQRLYEALDAGGQEHRKATIEIGGMIDPRSDWMDAETDSVDDFSIIDSDVIGA